MIFKNKVGGVVLRDMLVFMLIFGGILALASIFVVDMGNTYGNDEMVSEWTNSNLSSSGDAMISQLNSSMGTARDATSDSDGIIGTFQNTFGGNIVSALKGAGTVLGMIFKTPVYIGDAFSAMLITLQIPPTIATIVGNLFSFALYIIVIFSIVTAALRGGKM